MPIEVRELVFKALVQQDRAAAAGSAAGAGAKGDNDVKPDEEMLNKCIETITEILKERHER
jgi:hypothetical protein